MATHSSILAWEIPGTEDPGSLQSRDHKELDTTNTFTFTITNKEIPVSVEMVSSVSKHHSLKFALFLVSLARVIWVLIF